MKPNRNNLFLAAFISFTLAAPSASAANYFWDDNAAGAGFGTAGANLGTWAGPTTGPVAGWSLSGTGANAFASFTTATTDTVNFGNGATGLAAGTITVSGTVSTGNMTFASGSGAITLSGGIINLGGSRTITANNANNVITSEIALSGASIFRVGEIGSSADRLFTLGKLSGTGGATFEYTGGNNGRAIFLLNAASTYSGNTTITAPASSRTEVRLGVVNALPTTTVLTLDGIAGSGSGRTTALNLNGNNQTLAGLAAATPNSDRTFAVFSSTAAVLTVNDSGNRTFAGLIGSGGTNISVIKQGAGNWTLSGANTYVGQTTVSAGTITVSNATALGTTAGNTVVSSSGRIFTGTSSISIAEAFNIAGTGTATNGAINIGGSATGVAFTGAITLSGNATIQGDGGTGTTFSGGINLGANTLTFKESGTITVNTAAISGTGGSIVKNTGGQTNLNFANTYTGDTTVNAGILSLGVSTAAGVGGTINLGATTGTANATLRLSGTSTNVANALTVRTGSSGTKTLSNASTNSTTYSGNITADDNLSIVAAMTGSSTFVISGTGNTIAANKTVSFSSTSASTGNLSDTALWSGDGSTSYTGSSSSSIVINGAKTYTGGSTVGSFSGTGAAVVAISSVGTGAGVTSGAFGTGILTLGNGAKLRSTNVADTTVGNTLTLAGDVTAITVTSEKSLIFSGPATLTGTRTFDVSIGNTVASKSLTFSGAIGESGGAQGITKTGNGNMLLSGDNSYTGATLISAGTLTLSGAGDINGSSGITVNGSGAKFLQTSSVASTPGITLTQGTLTGSGTVGAVNVADTVNAIISNNNGVAGASLTIGALTFNGAATVNTFSSSTAAPIIIATSLDSNAAGSVIINPTAASWANGSTYDLISYGTIGGAGLGQFALGTVTGLTARQVTAFGSTATAITLGISGDTAVWSGLGAATWATAATNDNTGPNDWALKTAQTATNFWATDAVEFNDTYDIGGGPVAVTNTAVTITGGVAPSSTVFNNSAVNYTVTSSDATGITSGSLTKSGSGSVSINTNNTFSGGTTVSGGTLTAAKNAATLNALGTGAVSIASGSTLVIDLLKTTNVTDTIANTFTGDGLLKLQFADDITARSASMPNVTGFSGTIQLSTLGTTGDKWAVANLGTIAGSLVVDSGNTIFLSSGTTSFTGGITLNGAGNSEGRGAIRLSGATTVLAGDISLASSSTLSMENAAAQVSGNISSGVAGTQTLTLGGTGSTGGILSGNIGGGTGTIAITQAVGSYTLSGDNTYTGDTIVNAGNLSITHNNALGSTAGATTVNGGNTTTGFGLSLSAATTGLTIAENINLFGNVSGRAQVVNSSALNHTLTGAIDVSSDTNLAQFTSSGAGSITISGDITGTMTNGALLFLRGASTSASNQLIGSVNLTGGNFAKTDAGTWLVGASGETYSWANTIHANGRLNMGAANVLPATGTVTMGENGARTPTLDINGFNQTTAGITYGGGTGTGTRTITNSDIANPAVFTINNATDNISGFTSTNTIVFTGNLGLTKQGNGKLTLLGTNTYTGATLVSAGTLFVTGSLTSDVTVSDNATVGGGGTVGDISFGGGSFFDIALAVGSADSLTTGAISFAAAGFGVDNLVFNGAAVDWGTVADGTYTLLTGSLNSLNLDNFGLANAFDIGGGRTAHFESGSLNLVVIPEPNVAALIGAFGGILLLRRRR